MRDQRNVRGRHRIIAQLVGADPGQLLALARDPSYNEAEVSEAMKNPKIQIKIALGLGKGRDRVLTCDLTKEYVAINGDYRS